MLMIKHRPGTQDEHVYREVIEQNEYRLPSTLRPEDVVIDVGAHIGIFAAACLARGAGTVLAFEADKDNFALLQENLVPKEGQHAEAFNLAVWKPGPETMYFTGYPDFFNACGSILPNGTVGHINKRIPIMTCTLDDILEVVEQSGKRVRLLKIDAEFAEYPIIYSSKKLGLVDEIVMEVHEMPELPEEAKVKGFTDYTANGLRSHLHRLGFRMRWEWLREPREGHAAFHLFGSRATF